MGCKMYVHFVADRHATYLVMNEPRSLIVE